jgi:hypothetical protein
MTEPNNIRLLGSGTRIVLDDCAVTEILSTPIQTAAAAGLAANRQR